MAKMIQFMSETGEKQYPATSSEAVGMSDGSGNLDAKLAELEVKSIIKELFCLRSNTNFEEVSNIRIYVDASRTQLYLRKNNGDIVAGAQFTSDGSNPSGIYKLSQYCLIFVDNWNLKPGEYIIEYQIKDRNYNIEFCPRIKNYLTNDKYVTDNDIINSIFPEIYLYNKTEVNKILLNVYNDKKTINVFLLNDDVQVAYAAYENGEIPTCVTDLTLEGNQVGKIVINYSAFLNFVDGAYTYSLSFNSDIANNIYNFPIILAANPQVEFKDSALHVNVSSNEIVNGVISEMILPSTINYKEIKRIRFVNSSSYKQIFLQSENGNTTYDGISIVSDGTTPKGLYKGQNFGVLYHIKDWSLLTSGESIFYCDLTKKVTDINYNTEIRLILNNEIPTSDYILNSIIKEIFLDGVCKYSEISAIRLTITGNYYQIFIFKDGDSQGDYTVIAQKSISDNGNLESGVYDVGGIKLYIDAENFKFFLKDGDIHSYFFKCNVSEYAEKKFFWNKISNYDANEYIDNMNIIKGKKEVLWLGTSIPAGSPWGAGYPKIIGEALNVSMYNNAIGGSYIQYRDVLPEDESENGKCISLSQSRAEKEEIFGDAIVNWDESYKNIALNCGYDTLIIPYIDGTKAKCDTIIFDHGWNDQDCIREMYAKIEDGSIDDSYMQSRDRRTFIGAFNYLYDKIQEVNPRIRIIIGGYHENESDNKVGYEGNSSNIGYYGKQVCAVQEYIAQYYSIPIIKMWEKCNFTFKKIVPNTSTYIQDMGYERNPFIKDENGNISMFDYYHPDCIHPFSSEKEGGAMAETYLSRIYIQELRGYIS